jgi:hypothetical protein
MPSGLVPLRDGSEYFEVAAVHTANRGYASSPRFSDVPAVTIQHYMHQLKRPETWRHGRAESQASDPPTLSDYVIIGLNLLI